LKVAVLFENLGPYHLARLRAAVSQMEVLAVEFASTSSDYAWSSTTREEPFQRVTLFPDGDSRSESAHAFLANLSNCLEIHKPDAVAIPGWSGRGAFTALQCCLRKRIPVIAMSDSAEQDEPRTRWKEWIKHRYVSLCSSALVAGYLHAEYVQKLGMLREHTFTGYDVVDNQHFCRQRTESVFSHPRENEESRPFFLASARFIPKKNLGLLLRAYAQYRATVQQTAMEKAGSNFFPCAPVSEQGSSVEPRFKCSSSTRPEPWPLVVLGDGPLREKLSSDLSSLGLQEHVRMPGFKQYDELPEWYACAGAFVHARTTEQWGLVVNEAAAAGLPLLVSKRCGCVPELVREGANGFTFDPANVEELAELMLKVSALNFPLAAFGAESKRIIAGWGPDRFAGGLRQATECAIRSGPKNAGLVDRLLLTALARR
jgi:glycosyltransferase involved in cell wall biosynthesis